jgi:hypothetical protein
MFVEGHFLLVWTRLVVIMIICTATYADEVLVSGHQIIGWGSLDLVTRENERRGIPAENCRGEPTVGDIVLFEGGEQGKP